MSNIRGVGKDVQHLRSRRLRSSVDSMKEKQPIMSMGFINFWHLLHFKDVSFVTHGGSIFKKKQTRETGVTWAGLQFQSSFQQLMRSN